MNSRIVIGSFYGDEGKGATVNSLSSSLSSVIRFNGGPQAGHTVYNGGKSHVFSSFCSGVFNGSTSMISKYCAIYPPAIVKERDDLFKKTGKHYPLVVHPLTPLIIPTDVINSQRHIDHSNCGHGFGECIKRHETLDYPLRLFANDLHDLQILRLKLETGTTLEKKDIDYYMNYCKDLIHNGNFLVATSRHAILTKTNNVSVFEGAQGVLLDRQYGFFPHCTRSNTTIKNALEIILEERNSHIMYKDMTVNVDVYMAMRPYITRHGIGPLPYEYDKPMVLLNNENETNVNNKYQGPFRYAPFNFDLLKYSMQLNKLISDAYYPHIRVRNWFASVTCLDQIPGLIHCIDSDKHEFLEKDVFLTKLASLGFNIHLVNGIELVEI